MKEKLRGRIHKSWEQVFEGNSGRLFLNAAARLIKSYDRKDIQGFRIAPYTGNKMIPRVQDLLHPFRKVPLDKVKVVILNSFPINSLDITGIPFLLQYGKTTTTANNPIINLDNAYCKYKNDAFQTVDIESWMEQGVLLLNVSLTIEYNSDQSHNAVWRPFTISIIKAIYKQNPDCVFVALGNLPKRIFDELPSIASVVDCPEPCRYPAKRRKEFIDCEMFERINQELTIRNINTIDW